MSARPKKQPRPIRFRAEIENIGRSTILRLPADASAKLPSRGQVAVTGVINRHPFQTVLEPDGRRGHWLKLDTKLRRALRISDGVHVTVEVEPAEQWPEPAVPKDFRAALADAPDIHQLWNEITPAARWEWVRYSRRAGLRAAARCSLAVCCFAAVVAQPVGEQLVAGVGLEHLVER